MIETSSVFTRKSSDILGNQSENIRKRLCGLRITFGVSSENCPKFRNKQNYIVKNNTWLLVDMKFSGILPVQLNLYLTLTRCNHIRDIKLKSRREHTWDTLTAVWEHLSPNHYHFAQIWVRRRSIADAQGTHWERLPDVVSCNRRLRRR